MWHGFDIGFIHISSFGLMMFLAFLSCNLVIRKTLKEKSINPIINNSQKEFELVNAISLRIVVARTNQSYIQVMIEEAKSLLDMINNELDKN